jgi:magnesium-transporting ATPase (P-type)
MGPPPEHREVLSPVPLHPERASWGEVASAFGTDASCGLGEAEAARRLRRYGANALPPPKRPGWPARLVRQLKEPMVLLLLGAALVAGVGLDERLDAAAIAAIVVLNAAIALIQEGKATRALEALKSLETPTARVLRDGRAELIPAGDLVPGDVVLLTAGDRVPADLRLFEVSGLEVDESLLTGESLPVTKDSAPIAGEPSVLAEKYSLAFSGTVVVRGTGRGIVVATGKATALGSIAAGLAGPRPLTPLELKLRHVTARLGSLAVALAWAVFLMTLLLRGLGPQSLQRSFLSAVALAVAAVPEGLATVVTVALALGVRRMAERGSIVRRLPAVETLGSTSVIVTDKTGTLTENRMRLEIMVWAASRRSQTKRMTQGWPRR